MMKTKRNKKKCMRMATTIFICVCCAVIFGSLYGIHDAMKFHGIPVPPNRDVYYHSQYITYGDTLWSMYDTICDQYPETREIPRSLWISNVQHTNHVVLGRITAGSYVIVPYYVAVSNAGVARVLE